MKRTAVLALVIALSVTASAKADVTESAFTVELAPLETPEPVLPGIVFRSGSFRKEETEISVVLEAGETALLEEFDSLKACHFEGSTCYEEIMAYAAAHEDVAVTWSVPVCGREISSLDTEAVFDKKSVSAREIAEALPFLPSLESVSLGGAALTAEECALFGDKLGSFITDYAVSAAGLTLNADTESISLKNVPAKKAEELAAAAKYLPALTKANASGSNWSLSDVALLMNACPSLTVDYPVHEFGVDFSTASTSLTLSGKKLKKTDIARLKELVPLLPRCEKVIMEDCGLTNEEMDALRTELAPYTEIVWRVKCGAYSCRTDSVMIKFSSGGSRTMSDRQAENLKYCRDVVYLDLGHNKLRHIGFVAGMKDLQVCIIAVNYLTDIEGIENCKKLEYCEFLSGIIKDISPLAACTELEHLNIAYNQITDISPLYGLTKLKRLWISRNKFPDSQIDEIKAALPDCLINTTAHNPTSEGWREDPRYDILREQFQYDDSHARSAYYQDGVLVYDRAH